MADFRDAYVEKGIARWTSNNRVPPEDVLRAWADAGHMLDVERSRWMRASETASFLARYRRQNANREPSPEEMFEMRAAFGPGAEVVNVVTGRVTRT